MKEINEQEFNVLIKQKDKLLIDFYADWCMPCQILKPMLEKIEKEMGIEIYKVNIDANQHLSSSFNVMSIPTLVFIDNGKEKDRIVGLVPEKILKDWIAKNLK